MKYALVTGASRGIGQAIAKKLAATGIPVVVNYLNNVNAAQTVIQDITDAGGTAELLPFDASNPQAIDAAIDAWEQAHPDDYISVLVNNAGIRRDNVMFMMPDEDWHKVLDTTLNGFFYITRRLLKHMMPRRRGGSKGCSYWRNKSACSGSGSTPGDCKCHCTRLYRNRHDPRPSAR